jgi:hypothetical protein
LQMNPATPPPTVYLPRHGGQAVAGLRLPFPAAPDSGPPFNADGLTLDAAWHGQWAKGRAGRSLPVIRLRAGGCSPTSIGTNSANPAYAS